MNKIREEIRKEYFDKLAEKLEELFPKTNQDHPEVPSEGNRSAAIVLNAYANIYLKDFETKLLQSLISEIERREKDTKSKGWNDCGCGNGSECEYIKALSDIKKFLED